MSVEHDFVIATRLAAWLEANGCTVSIVYKLSGHYVHYTLKLDIKPQPPARIKDGAISFPAGSQEDVVLAFLLQQ